ncbi:MAG: flavin reductase family protein [Desulfurococcales archaeon]|nr:flavin reductase family protein [Desulfurococcales archaeon]
MAETPPENWYLILHPRPAYIVVSGAEGRKAGVMAASWVSPASEEPPRITLAIDVESHTYSVIKEIKDFTVNIVFTDLIDLVWNVGRVSGREVDKVSKFKIELTKSRKVKSPRLANAKAVIEASLWKEEVLGDTSLIIADVLDAYVLEDELFDWRYGWRVGRAQIPLHLGGKAFTSLGKLLIAGSRK